MPRQDNSLSQVKWPESYASLLLGFLVVFVAVILVFVFARNKTAYDRINTSESTVELSKPESQKQTPSTYEIKVGDNLWNISEKLYGSGYNWIDLAKANNLSNPNLVVSGTKLKIPEVQKITVAEVSPTQNNGQSISGTSYKGNLESSAYKVVKGDHLWGISVRAYGDGFKWPELARVNNIPNPDLIYPDAVLKLPR